MSGGRHTASSTRGRDEAREIADAEEQHASTIWQRIRHSYNEQVRSVVDACVEQGGLTLSDIEALEYAEHERILSMVATYMGREKDQVIPQEDGPPKIIKGRSHAIAISHLMSLRLQSRKHLRTLRLAMSPIQTPNESHPVLPEALRRRIDSVTEGDPADVGDDLLA